jgi:hypothetical protein
VVFQYPCTSLEDPKRLIDFALRKSAMNDLFAKYGKPEIAPVDVK